MSAERSFWNCSHRDLRLPSYGLVCVERIFSKDHKHTDRIISGLLLKTSSIQMLYLNAYLAKFCHCSDLCCSSKQRNSVPKDHNQTKTPDPHARRRTMERMTWWHRCQNLGESYENVGIVGIIITPVMIIRIIIITMIIAICDNCGTHIIVSTFLHACTISFVFDTLKCCGCI